MLHSFRLPLLSIFAATLISGANILVDPSPGISTPAVVKAITGADMVGLNVTFRYWYPSGVVTVSAPWVATGSASGGVSLGLHLTGPTNGYQAWLYTGTRLSTFLSLELDGSAAGIFFDRGGPTGGLVLSPLFPQGVEQGAIVTYSDAVGIGGQPPQGDLYAKLKIDFSSIGSSGLPGLIPQDFRFTQAASRTAVPEPNSLNLIGAALALIFIKDSVLRKIKISGSRNIRT